jgi:hypothetical protein
LCSCRLTDHDRRGRVILLHRGVCASEKRSIRHSQLAAISNYL